jgi:GNAT superfamily N-acetyltransferase
MLLSYSRDVGEVRRVKPGDVDDLDEVFRKSWSEGFSDIIDDKDQENVNQGRRVTEDDIQQRMRQDGILTLVYAMDGTVLGQGRIAWSDDTTESYTDTGHDEAELRSMYVHPDHWNEGIGSEMMEALVERCPVEPSALKAETYEGSDAAEFYRSKGFKVAQRSTVEAVETGMSRDYSAVVLERS